MNELHGRLLRLACVVSIGAASGCGSEAPPERGLGMARTGGDSSAAAAPAASATPPAAPTPSESPGNEATVPAALAEPDDTSSAGDSGPPLLPPAPPADPGADRCDVGVFDPSSPPRALTLSGSLGAHDPVIVAAGGSYHFFSTGAGISVKTSPDLLTWTQAPEVFPTTPAWFQELVPDYTPRSIWAPDVSNFGGQFHLYYSVSSFGSNRSCIGHATRPDLQAGSWTDHEAVFCSNQPGQPGNYNAIDPNVILDEAGTPWLAFGSFWSGIKLIRLDLAGARSGTELLDLASRGGGAIEGPFVVRRCGYYYLFVSFDTCCRGADSTYNVRVGRSQELRGPYVDRANVALMNGGGTLVLQGDGDWAAAGHNAILIDGTRAYNVYHAYAATNGASRLRISELVWDAEGWPVSGGP